MLKTLLLFVPFLVLLAFGPAEAQTPSPAPVNHVKITLTPEHNKVVADGVLWVLIHEDIEPGWHTYWVNPGDSGLAPRITWHMPDGFSVNKTVWPTPEKIDLGGGLVSYGFKGQATFAQTLVMPDKLPAGPIVLKADIELLVCKNICIPETSTHTITLNDPAAAPQDNEKQVDAFVNALPRHSDWTGTYAEDGKDLVVRLQSNTLESVQDADPKSFVFLPEAWGLVKNAADARADTSQPPVIVLRQERDTRALAGIGDFPAIITFKTKAGAQQARRIDLRPAPAMPELANSKKKTLLGTLKNLLHR